MTIKSFTEIHNPNIPNQEPIKEVMDIQVPKIIDGISNRNGMIYCISGSGGSGKTSMMLNFFRSKNLYRGKFDNIYYICPSSSFLSVSNHPFKDHDKVYHHLTEELLYTIYDELISMKKKNIEKKKKTKYNLIIIDDYAADLKDKQISLALNMMIIKARHLCTGFIFTLQSYFYFPKILRKQITFTSIFKPKNVEEWYSVSSELLNLNKIDALKLYDFVYSDGLYNHIDLDTVKNIMYKNFNRLEINI